MAKRHCFRRLTMELGVQLRGGELAYPARGLEGKERGRE